MAKSSSESKIPIFHTNHLKNKISRPLSTLSSRLRAHLDGDNRSLPSSVLLSILSANVKNINFNKNAAISHSSKSHHISSQDERSTRRPTNIFTSERRFPSATTSRRQPQQPDLSVIGSENVGKRVRLGSGKEGILRFVGETQFGEGVWCGVELDSEEGSSDGVVDDVRYFSCRPNRGVFALVSNVKLVADDIVEYVSDVCDSGPCSLLGITGDARSSQNEPDQIAASSMAFRHSNNNLHNLSLTPTPNSSNNSFLASAEWRCNSLHSSSTSSLVLNSKGLPVGFDPSSLRISKHSSVECDESLGILTPDQMADLTTCSADASVLGGGSCEDFGKLSLPEHRAARDTGRTKCPSADNILTLDEGPEILDRLFSETETCVMSTSSISDNLGDAEKDLTLKSPVPLVDEFPELAELSATLLADEQLDVVDVMVPVTVAAVATSFVTSVTSIGSWDNGYQGDGEGSRPTSRGPEASPLAKVKTLPAKGLEPMTDSDFYTESEADLYEELTCAKRDRRAYVIDGKLFESPDRTQTVTSRSCCAQILSVELCNGGGGGGQKERSVPEDMDSSGIYSDLDKRSDVVVEEKRVAAAEEMSDVQMSEDARLDESPKSFQSVGSQRLAIELLKEQKEIGEKELKPKAKRTNVDAAKTMENNLKRRNDNLVKGKEFSSKLTNSPSANKPKIPRRNVISKVKNTTNGSSKCSEDENQENRPVNVKSNAKKMGKWDSVVSRIEKSKVDDKMKNNKIKDVKSKVNSALLRSSQNDLNKETVKPFSPKSNSMTKMPSLSARQKENLSYRFKTRKIRNRVPPDESVAVTAPVLSRTSSRTSSLTDISDSHLDISQHSLPAVVSSSNFSNGKKISSPICSPLSETGVSTNPLRSLMVNTKDLKISTLPDPAKTTIKQRQAGSVNSLVENHSSTMKVPRKMTYRRTLPKIAPLKDQNQQQSSNSISINGTCSIKSTFLKPLSSRSANTNSSKTAKTKAAKDPTSVVKVNPLLSQLKHATNGMESFIILFQRLTADMDVFALPSIKKDLNKYKADWLDMKLKFEEANVSCRRLKKEIETHKIMYDQKIEELKKVHSADLGKLDEMHREELELRENRYEKEINELEEKLEKQEIALQAKFEEKLREIRKQTEDRIESILDEAKNQVEMLNLESDAWKERLIKESMKKLQDLETKFKIKMERVENNYLSELNEADEKARKNEELFLSPVRRRQSCTFRNGADVSKSTVEASVLKPDVQALEEEISSLRVVLDMKQSEIQELRKQNEKLKKDVQDLPSISQKLYSSQARVEDLTAQLQSKTENEERLLKEIRKWKENCQHEKENKKRLSFQNEELLWKLKKSSQVAKTLAVFGSNLKNEDGGSETPEKCNSPARKLESCRCRLSYVGKPAEKSLKRSRTDADIKLIESPQDNDASPKVLGVVEKNDSVSWVLEIDEPPLAVASRMLRRASSLRGVPPVMKRSVSIQQSSTLPSRNKKSAATSPIEDIGNTAGKTPLEEWVSDKLEDASSNVEKKENDDELELSADVTAFFDFLQDSDCDGELLSNEENIFYSGVDVLPYNFSSSSSDSSLNLELYEQTTKREYVQNGEQTKSRNGATDSASLSDTEDSELVDNFQAPSSAPILN